MTFTYGPDYTSDLAQVRLALGDTNSASPIFTDEEITAVLTAEGSVNEAVVVLAESAAAKFARLGDITIDGASFRYSDIAANFKAIATRAGSGGPGDLGVAFVGGVSQGARDVVRDSTDRVPNAFRDGMFDNNG